MKSCGKWGNLIFAKIERPESMQIRLFTSKRRNISLSYMCYFGISYCVFIFYLFHCKQLGLWQTYWRFTHQMSGSLATWHSLMVIYFIRTWLKAWDWYNPNHTSCFPSCNTFSASLNWRAVHELTFWFKTSRMYTNTTGFEPSTLTTAAPGTLTLTLPTA